MGIAGQATVIRRATAEDEAFVYDVFCTGWEQEVSAMPNPSLVQHFLRIQYTSQNRRFQSRFPDHERWVVMHDGKRAGRLFLHRSPSVLHVIDMTLLPQFRSAGIGSGIVHALFREAREHGQLVSMRVSRRNVRAANLYNSLGFRLVTMDDMDSYFEWNPALTAYPAGEPVADRAQPRATGMVSSHSVP